MRAYFGSIEKAFEFFAGTCSLILEKANENDPPLEVADTATDIEPVAKRRKVGEDEPSSKKGAPSTVAHPEID